VAFLLVIDTDPAARERVDYALAGLGYEVSFVDHPREWLPGLQVDLVLTSASALDQGARQAFLEVYEAASTGPPVLLWSPELSKERMIALMPPTVQVGAVFEAVPSAAELLLFVTGRFPPSKRGVAVERLLRELSRHREPLRSNLDEGDQGLADVRFIRSLVTFSAEKWTGRVLVDSGSAEPIGFWLEDGVLTLATDGVPGRLLEEARRRSLVRGGELPEEAFADLREELRFLRRSAGLSSAERTQLLGWYVSELLRRVSEVSEGTVKVAEGEKPPLNLGFGMDVPTRLVAAATRGVDFVQPLDEWFVVPSLPRGEESEQWEVSGTAEGLLEYLSANRKTRMTVGGMKTELEASRHDPQQVGRLLRRLEEMGYVRFVGSPFGEVASAAIAEGVACYRTALHGTHFDLLGLSETATKEVVDAAVLSASRKWHPDALVSQHPRVQALGERLFGMVRDAADTLGDPRRREAYLEDLEDGQVGRGGKDPERARILLAKAKLSIKAKRYAVATKELEAALVADPSLYSAKVLGVWAGWLGKAETVESSIQTLQTMGREPDASAQLWYFLGRMYVHVSNPGRARKCFGKALELDPQHAESKSELRLIDRRAEKRERPAKKSFFDRLRGR
jgi:tetratricopeptide (TPR) repeat protein